MEIEKRDLELQQEFPKILKDLGGDPSKTCMSSAHGGIAIGDGWIPLIKQLMHFCQFHHDKNGYPQLVADQIKEKFGTLRFYYHFEDCNSDTKEYGIRFNRIEDTLEGAIHFAESLSSTICESCGKPGTLRGQGWRYTSCDECEKLKMDFTKEKN
ncbi:MAG: hypothetical protein U9N54_00675 [candidate division Zixibacteria bacterium]|nr:hypothetical protein [candidate division Zixibacteria bacterium]